jgi:hypothetical protein
MFQNPRIFVEKEHGIETGSESRIYVAFGTVSDHPGCVSRDFVACEDGLVGGWVLLGDDFEGCEIRRQAGTADLVGLLGVIAFGHEDEAVA